jgi:uncharacterized membrane protein
MLDYLLLILGFLFTFFLPGYLIIETFFKEIPKIYQLPLYFLLSIIVSTYLVYFLSLIFGFSRFSILFSLFLFFLWFLFYLFKNKRINLNLQREHDLGIFLSLFVFLIYFVALYPAIFKIYRGYIVMSGPNWQDTALHLGIIQSISQGNFPPQAPYYAGRSLTYYYFTDFHSAILLTLFSRFFPRILVYDNPFFPAIFALSIYCLVFYLTKKKSISFASAFTCTFFSSALFIRFFQDLFQNPEKTNLIKKAIYLISNNSYSLEYEKLFQLSNVADYFLQNRAMMVGFPAIVSVLFLVLYGLRKKSEKIIFLSALISASLFKFQLFAAISSLIIFLLATIFYFEKKEWRFYLKSFFIFLILFLIPTFLFKGENTILMKAAKEHFSFGPWEKEKNFSWYLKFIFANFGLPFVLNFLAFFYAILATIKTKKLQKDLFFVSALSLVLFSIPFSFTFTIYKGDMFKFFYIAILFATISSFWFLSIVIKNRPILIVIILFLLIFSTASSFLTLTHSFLNKTGAYSLEDLNAGIWIRKFTPKNSIFIGMPTVHSPIDQIGGRLRVLSYINWPYSHGYYLGEDNVFKRLEDIENLYQNSKNKELVLKIMEKYKADYIFYGPEEKRNFPEAATNFDQNENLKKVYESNEIQIWKKVK